MGLSLLRAELRIGGLVFPYRQIRAAFPAFCDRKNEKTVPNLAL
tara:strand:+ start:4752 stop:4883 length:132 start_codon:yes stop_codon:yes gene_type:complete